jgi:hypothetical protein
MKNPRHFCALLAKIGKFWEILAELSDYQISSKSVQPLQSYFLKRTDRQTVLQCTGMRTGRGIEGTACRPVTGSCESGHCVAALLSADGPELPCGHGATDPTGQGFGHSVPCAAAAGSNANPWKQTGRPEADDWSSPLPCRKLVTDQSWEVTKNYNFRHFEIVHFAGMWFRTGAPKWNSASTLKGWRYRRVGSWAVMKEFGRLKCVLIFY